MNKNLKALLKQVNTVLRCIKKFITRPQNSLYRLIYIGFIFFLITLSQPFIPYSLLSTHFLPSRVLAQSTDGKKAEADKLLQQGIKQYETSQFNAALKSLQQALDIYRETKERQLEGFALVSIGATYRSLGDYPKAIDYNLQFLKITQEIKNRKWESNALNSLGIVYFTMGDYPEAIEYFQRALKIVQEIKDSTDESITLSGLAAAYSYLGDDPKAIQYYLQSLKIAQEMKDRKGEATALDNLGTSYKNMGDYSKAIEYHLQSLKIAQEMKYYQEEDNALSNLGNVYRALEDYQKAIQYHLQCLKIAQQMENPTNKGSALFNLGITYSFMGDDTKAIKYHLQSLKIAQQIKDRNREGTILGVLGFSYASLGDYSKAIEYQMQHLKIAQEIKDRDGEGMALDNLGHTYYKIGNFQLAESTLFKSMKVKESLRGRLKDKEKISMFETQRNTYNTLQQVLIVQNKTDTALEIAERGRARAFIELLASKLSNNLNEQLSTPPNIEQIKQIAKSQNATFVEYSRLVGDFKIEGKSRAKESELYTWVIKPTGEVTFRKSDLKPLWQKENTELAQLVTKSRSSIGARGRGIKVTYNPDNISTAEKNLKRLHELLIKPIADLLPTNENEKVIFIPQDSLFLVPFPALLDSNNKFLIEKHTILTSPAIQVLGLTQKQKQKVTGKSALIVGNPTISPDVINQFGLSPLPGAEKEATEIATILNTQPILTKQATKALVLQKMASARIIHLATHGLIDDIKNLGVPGAVVLASDGKDNGLLTSGEILDLKLGAELIVLSACDTGVGKLTGDGVIGLSRSLITAGTPSVIVTLWKIADESSKLLMTDFYRNLQQNPDKAIALRKAMLNTMKTHPQPSDWAAFTLIGEAN